MIRAVGRIVSARVRTNNKQQEPQYSTPLPYNAKAIPVSPLPPSLERLCIWTTPVSPLCDNIVFYVLAVSFVFFVCLRMRSFILNLFFFFVLRQALQDLESTAGRLERMFRRLHMRLDAVNPGDVSFS